MVTNKLLCKWDDAPSKFFTYASYVHNIYVTQSLRWFLFAYLIQRERERLICIIRTYISTIYFYKYKYTQIIAAWYSRYIHFIMGYNLGTNHFPSETIQLVASKLQQKQDNQTTSLFADVFKSSGQNAKVSTCSWWSFLPRVWFGPSHPKRHSPRDQKDIAMRCHSATCV